MPLANPKNTNSMEAKMLDIRINELDVDTYLNLRAFVNWKVLKREQAELALKNSLYTVVAYLDEKAVGMGRLVGDGAIICYVQDLVVRPDVQTQGVGRQVLQRIIEHVEEIRMDNSEMMLCLMCAKGREPFYKKFGFIERPTEKLGPGMIQYLNNNTMMETDDEDISYKARKTE